MTKKVFVGSIILFFVTLQPFYFRSISLAPFPLIAFFLVILITYKGNISLNEFKEFVTFLTLILISVFIGLFNFTDNGTLIYYFPSLFGWFLFPLGIIYFKRYLNYLSKDIYSIVHLVLLIHVFFFFLQLLSFKLFNIKLDFIEIITGEAQRIGANKLKDFGGSNIRPAGLFTEPGSYSVYIYILVVINLVLKNKINILIFFALVSMFLSFSMTGILMAISLILFYISIIKISKKSIISLIIFSIALILFFWQYSEIFLGPIIERLFNLRADASAEARFESGVNQFISQHYLYHGIGIGVQVENIKATSLMLGTLFSLGLINSLMFISIFLYKILRANKSIIHCFLLLPVIFSNISMVQVIFILFISFMLIPKIKEN